MKKINLNKISYTQMINKNVDEKFSKYVSISDIFKLNGIQIFHEKLAPNTRASNSHTHTHKEEIFFILLGKPTLFLNEESIELEENDIIFFEPNNNEYHFLMNNTEEDVNYLIIAKNYESDRVYYKK
ncbi:MAG: cupin domain-containing protein [Candidatus Sericytochromatia bacterium]